MKWCTRFAVHHVENDVITDCDIIDISIVDDDHQFGMTDDGTELHFEADLKPC
jgi:hypothetical protein